MAQFNSLTDRVRQMLGGIPQTLSDIGNRVGSNMQWAGNQIQQNVVKPVQQIPSQVFSPQNVNAFQRGVLKLPAMAQNSISQAAQSPYPLQSFIPKKIMAAAPEVAKYFDQRQTPVLLSKQGLGQYAKAVGKTFDPISDIALAPYAGVKTYLGAAGIGSAFNAGSQIVSNIANKNPLLDNVLQAANIGAQQGIVQTPKISAITGGVTNPVIQNISAKVLQKFPQLSATGMQIVNRVVQGTLSIPEGRAIAKATGQDYNLTSAAIDFAIGAGIAPKVGKMMSDNVGLQVKPMGDIMDAQKVANLEPISNIDKEKAVFQVFQNTKDFKKARTKFWELIGSDGNNPDSVRTNAQANREVSRILNKYKGTTISTSQPKTVRTTRVAEQYKANYVSNAVDPFEAIKNEAKKYKSAEEFVNVMRTKHRPPDIEGGSPLHDLTSNGSFPKDIYSNKATRLYGDYGMAGEKEAIGIIQQFKGKPDAEVTIYRAINPNETSAIKGGDWVTISKDYAKQHGESNLEKGFKIISKKVKAGDILNDGNSILEWGYRPDGHTDLSQSQLTDIWNKANKEVASTSQPKTVRTIKVADQSRTQQPISSPASGNVGTVAGASGGQTSQPILGTAPLNKSIPQRGFAESVQTNKKTPAEIKPELEKIRYEPISNAETMAQADKIVQTDELKALDFAKNNTDTTANSVSLKLIEKYLDQGRFSEANDLISAVAPRFTKAGQEIQILSTYGRLTPTGAIKYAQTLINQANKANPKLNLKLTEANTKIITEYANKVQSLPVGSRERIVATAHLMQKITDQVPPSIGQKIATIQTMMQLLNPKTAIRNIIGNTLFTGAENISDVFATGLDRITSVITGRRSKVLPSITAQGRGFIKGGREGFQDAMLGIDTSGGVSSQFEIKGKTFTDPIFGSLEKALNIELRVPDRAAYTAAFEGSLNNQMRAAGVTKATPEMIEIAHADGLYRTFQDNSRLAQIFSGVKKTLNKIGTPDGKFGLGDFVLKYPKTPANILSRGLDYSPAGFVKGIYEGIRPFISGQPFNQKQFVESLSRAMTGTGLITAGYILAKNGIISGKSDKDYDISSVKRTTGQGAFKMNVSALARYFQSGGQKQDDQNGDMLVSYDWAQPTSIQIAMGANSALGGSAEDMASIASDNLQAGVDTLTGQSMVKNLMDYAAGVKDKGFVGATQDMVLNSATGFVPSMLRQSANVFDPLQRSTYAETPGGVAINKAKATIPFLRNTLEPKLDVFGKEMPNYEGSGLQRMFDIFVNPAFVTKIQENPAAREVIDIYQRSGLTTQAPRVADSKIKINGQDVRVSPQQYTEYQRYIGTRTDKIFNALMNDPLFKKSSDEEKAKLLQGVLTDINSAAKIELFGNKPKTVPQDVKDILKGSSDSTGRMLTLTKEGNLKMATGDIEYPKLTGNLELDKKLLSSYRGKLTQKANEITAMYEAGEITAAQAETELNKLIELKNKASTARAKKAPKITVRKLSAPKVAKSARIKIKIPKIKKPKTLKLKKYTVKLSK